MHLLYMGLAISQAEIVQFHEAYNKTNVSTFVWEMNKGEGLIPQKTALGPGGKLRLGDIYERQQKSSTHPSHNFG